MKEYIKIILDCATLITLISGLYFGWRRFGLRRERFRFLDLNMDAKPIYRLQDTVLFDITIRLENKGDTRISARRSRRSDGYMYKDRDDICRHAGTLKVRSIPIEKGQFRPDWYSLPTIEAVNRVSSYDAGTDLEQVNYLYEFLDPEINYSEVDFWLEPHETYNLTVFVWLRPGIYAAKAFFLGELSQYREEEYWSSTIIFSDADHG